MILFSNLSLAVNYTLRLEEEFEELVRKQFYFSKLQPKAAAT
jgi:hypothetical protein